MITLALVGDVMLGRGVNGVLRTLRPEQLWGDVLPLLISADLRIVNLECAVTDQRHGDHRFPSHIPNVSSVRVLYPYPRRSGMF